MKRVLPIKFAVKICAFGLILAILLTGCVNPLKKHSPAEVDFGTVTKVQLTYKQNIYDVEIQFNRSVLIINFGNNGTAFDGLGYKITPEDCQVSFGGLAHSFEIQFLPEDFLPIVVYNFFLETGGVLVTENYDNTVACDYLTRAIGNCFVRFEVYENQGNISYTLIVT